MVRLNQSLADLAGTAPYRWRKLEDYLPPTDADTGVDDPLPVSARSSAQPGHGGGERVEYRFDHHIGPDHSQVPVEALARKSAT